MKALQKRSNAVMILVIVIVAATLFGMVRSANGAAAAVEKRFYSGVYLTDGKYTEPSIQQQLDKRATAALGMLTVANNDETLAAETKQLREAREALLEAKTIPEKYAANQQMETAWQKLYDAMKAKPGEIPASIESYTSTLSGAQSAIEKNHYNTAVKQFGTEIKAFPSGLLRTAGLINMPDTYGQT